jgi:hypothetical protein
MIFIRRENGVKGKNNGHDIQKIRLFKRIFHDGERAFFMPPAGSRQCRRQTVTGAFLF